MSTSRAIFSGGNFWDLQEKFDNINGILSTQCGYTGGRIPNPTYMEITSGKTGHAEAVEITYNPTKINYEKLLDSFFESHDPTDQHKKENHFRSVIFYLNDEQRRQAFKKIQALAASEKFKGPIMTELTLAGVFYPAEEYHQHYHKKHSAQTDARQS